jgi:tRNA 2-thiouridine synthesizing protein A
MVIVSLFGRRERAGEMTAPSTPVTPAALLTIDALGRKCPIPIIMLAEQIRDVPVGSIIAVRADDPAAYADVPSWCGMKSHEFVYRDALESGWEFGIRRQYLSRTMPRDSPRPADRNHLLADNSLSPADNCPPGDNSPVLAGRPAAPLGVWGSLGASRGSCVSPRWHLWVDSLPPKGAIGWKPSQGDVTVMRPSEGDVTVMRPGAGVDGG